MDSKHKTRTKSLRRLRKSVVDVNEQMNETDVFFCRLYRSRNLINQAFYLFPLILEL